jgi:hypothetical protein
MQCKEIAHSRIPWGPFRQMVVTDSVVCYNNKQINNLCASMSSFIATADICRVPVGCEIWELASIRILGSFSWSAPPFKKCLEVWSRIQNIVEYPLQHLTLNVVCAYKYVHIHVLVKEVMMPLTHPLNYWH